VGVGVFAGNLPAEVTRLVGRQHDVAQVERLLELSRLVVLTGYSGVGKSRVAMRVASRRQQAYEHGAWWVELSGVRDPELVAHTVARTLLVSGDSGRAAMDAVGAFLRDRQLLLVLDNCEHLLDACVALAETLLPVAPGLTILATSQQSFGLTGEYVWPVAPLAIPAPGQPLSPESLSRFPSLELFADRAAALLPEHPMTADDLAAAAKVCQRLDGIPLGIEMAAAWLRTLTVPEIAARLNDRFGFLAGRRAIGARHPTLRAAVQWSYELCSPTEQELWAQASSFAGGFDLAAAAVVCARDGCPPAQVLSTLRTLVDKSVLVCEQPGRHTRYLMLETLREYGWERLRERGDKAALRRAHRDYYLSLAEQLDAGWFGPDQLEWFSRLRVEHDNLRAALEFCLTTPGELDAGMRMAEALWFYWAGWGHHREGRHWLERFAQADPRPSLRRGRVLGVAGRLAALQGDLEAAQAMLKDARAVAHQFDDAAGVARAVHHLGFAFDLAGNVPRMLQHFDEALERYAALPEPDSMAPLCRMHRANAVAFWDDPEHGIRLCEEARQASEAVGELWGLSYMRCALAHALWRQSRLDAAKQHVLASLRLKSQFADMLGIAMAIEMLGWIATEASDSRRAAVFLGAAEQAWRRVGRPLFGTSLYGAPHAGAEASARKALGDADFNAAYRYGAERGLAETIASALDEQAADAVQAHPSYSGTGGATPAATDEPPAADDLVNSHIVDSHIVDGHVASRLILAEQQRDLANLLRQEAVELLAIRRPRDVIDRLAGTLARILPADTLLLVEHGRAGYYATRLAVADSAPRHLGAHPKLAEIVDATTEQIGVMDDLPGPLAALVADAASWLTIPLDSRGRRIGTLVLASTAPAAYGDAMTRAGVSFAGQAMSVYDNARAIEDRLTYQSAHDPLTALPNRLLLLSRIEQVLRDSHRDESSPALILLDLDGFKMINDSLGHRAGDLVLREVAGRLVRGVSSTDVVARIDGDEFVVMLRQPPNDTGLIDVARRLREAVSTPMMVDGQEVVLTASVGIARANPADAAEDLLRDAAAATHHVKSRGKNDHELFTEDVRRWAVDHLGTEADLRQGLRDNRFVLHHQPIVELASGHLAGVESLVRMQHPRRGLLGPGEFIRVAEDSGLIVPIGRWVLEQSCHELTRWKAGGACPPHMYMSVNVSAAQAARPELVDIVGGALAGSGLEADSLALELTESALIEADANTMRRLHDLRDIGVRLGIDDFGTGYSSLTYLKNLPVTFIKVDRSFVSGVVESRADRQIVTAVIRLAQGLGLSTIAEGVETADQLALLRELGCQHAQGYLLGRPRSGPPDRQAFSSSRSV